MTSVHIDVHSTTVQPSISTDPVQLKLTHTSSLLSTVQSTLIPDDDFTISSTDYIARRSTVTLSSENIYIGSTESEYIYSTESESAQNVYQFDSSKPEPFYYFLTSATALILFLVPATIWYLRRKFFYVGRKLDYIKMKLSRKPIYKSTCESSKHYQDYLIPRSLLFNESNNVAVDNMSDDECSSH